MVCRVITHPPLKRSPFPGRLLPCQGRCHEVTEGSSLPWQGRWICRRQRRMSRHYPTQNGGIKPAVLSLARRVTIKKSPEINQATIFLYVALAGRASSLKRRRWRTKQGDDGAAVKIARRSKPISDFGNRKRENFFLSRKSNQNAITLRSCYHFTVECFFFLDEFLDSFYAGHCCATAVS